MQLCRIFSLLLATALGVCACSSTGSTDQLDRTDGGLGLAGLPTLNEMRSDPMSEPAPVSPRSSSALAEVTFAADAGIYAQTNNTDFDTQTDQMLFTPDAGELAWVIYEREGIATDFYPSTFWVANNDEEHWVAVSNFEDGIWELYEGREVYYENDLLQGNKTDLKHDWDHYVSEGGSMFIAVLTQSDELATGLIGCDISHEPIKTPNGLRVDAVLGGMASLVWNDYSDARDLKLVVVYTLVDGELREKSLAEDETGVLVPYFNDSEFCIFARWPEKGTDGPHSAWVD